MDKYVFSSRAMHIHFMYYDKFILTGVKLNGLVFTPTEICKANYLRRKK